MLLPSPSKRPIPSKHTQVFFWLFQFMKARILVFFVIPACLEFRTFLTPSKYSTNIYWMDKQIPIFYLEKKAIWQLDREKIIAVLRDRQRYWEREGRKTCSEVWPAQRPILGAEAPPTYLAPIRTSLLFPTANSSQMKIYKTLLKYEIANENDQFGTFVTIMKKAFICLLLCASKKWHLIFNICLLRDS